jgi:hypothetical protein
MSAHQLRMWLNAAAERDRTVSGTSATLAMAHKE